MTSTSTGSSRCALVSGAGDPAGSRLTTSSGSSSRRPSRHGRGAVHTLEPAQAVQLPARAGDRGLAGAPGEDPRPRQRISLQRTRSWKQSPDPDYRQKAARILALYRDQPKNGVVISFDE